MTSSFLLARLATDRSMEPSRLRTAKPNAAHDGCLECDTGE